MCMCGRAVKNGEPGYSWDGKGTSIREVNPPDLAKGDTLLYDEPGRCGGLDSHSHHFRVVRTEYGGMVLLVRHGGGDERITAGLFNVLSAPLAAMSSTDRYWVLHAIYEARGYGMRDAREKENARWRRAAAEKRIKTRKMPGRDAVKVWIEDKALEDAPKEAA